jgi:hypothetical protein
MLLELLIEFKPIVLQFLDIIIRIFGIAFATLGIVYIAGRMLELLKTDRAKNILAIISIYTLQFLYELFELTTNKTPETMLKTLNDKGWNIFLYGTISIVIYVLVCWRLYSRIDKFLDKKIGEDEFKPTKKQKKK